MHATSDTDEKARVGDALTKLELTASSGQPVAIPDPAGDLVHLQFRRFAGVNGDYTQRVEPEEALAALDSLDHQTRT